MKPKVLISGASVAGPVLAFWLRRFGFTPTIVERTAALRGGTGGHAVDLFSGAVDVVDRMGLLSPIQEARTRTETVRFQRSGRRPVDVPMAKLIEGVTDRRHVEVMRGELAQILHGAIRDDVEFLFGDSITALDDDGAGVDVTFGHAEPRRFDLVVGADGLHSNVRALAFGPERDHRLYLGGYLAAFTMPGGDQVPGRMVNHLTVNRLAASYPVWQTGEARALFLFRRAEELRYDRHDVGEQRRLLKAEYAGAGVDHMLDAADDAPDFYLDDISQIRLDTWSRGRVTLVGDAGYSPGPAVGGGTTIAAVGAYLLAHHLATHDDHTAAFRAYENEMRPYVLRSRDVAPRIMRTFVPGSRAQVALIPALTKLLVSAPLGLRRRLLTASSPLRVLGEITLPVPTASMTAGSAVLTRRGDPPPGR